MNNSTINYFPCLKHLDIHIHSRGWKTSYVKEAGVTRQAAWNVPPPAEGGDTGTRGWPGFRRFFLGGIDLFKNRLSKVCIQPQQWQMCQLSIPNVHSWDWLLFRVKLAWNLTINLLVFESGVAWFPSIRFVCSCSEEHLQTEAQL